MRGLKLQKMGYALGVVIPEDVLERLHVKEGDELYLTETPDGAIRITPYDPEFDLQMRALRAGMFKYNKALKALSK